jgi:hypothetical protein
MDLSTGSRLWIDLLIRMYASPNASVLDVGSAEGALRYFGVDICKAVLERASKICALMKFVQSVANMNLEQK